MNSVSFQADEIYAAIQTMQQRAQSDDDAATQCDAGKFFLTLFLLNQSSVLNLPDFSTQFSDYFQQAAAQKYGLAYFYLGHIYQNGMGVAVDLKQAYAYYQQALDCGYVLAQQRLAYFYQQGLGVEKNINQAIFYYEKTIASSPSLQKRTQNFSLGFNKNPSSRTLLKKNKLLQHYPHPLINHLLLSTTQKIESGYLSALTNLGLLYFVGDEIPRDRAQAYLYLRQAANLGCPQAQMSLGVLYQEGQAIKQNYLQAAEFYQAAALQGHAAAQVSLGHFYQEGLGVKQDDQQAKYYYDFAAQAGNVDAYVKLGYCYHKGLGTTVDFDQALFFYQKAADQNHPIGLKNLGVMYYQGLGVDSDRSMAQLLWDKANQIIDGNLTH